MSASADLVARQRAILCPGCRNPYAYVACGHTLCEICEAAKAKADLAAGKEAGTICCNRTCSRPTEGNFLTCRWCRAGARETYRRNGKKRPDPNRVRLRTTCLDCDRRLDDDRYARCSRCRRERQGLHPRESRVQSDPTPVTVLGAEMIRLRSLGWEFGRAWRASQQLALETAAGRDEQRLWATAFNATTGAWRDAYLRRGPRLLATVFVAEPEHGEHSASRVVG